jgi:MFS family permease
MSETVLDPPLEPVRQRPRRPGRPTRPRPTVRPGVLLTLVLLGQFMSVLDGSVVNLAAPVLRADLHASGASMQLVLAGYTIAYAVLLVTGARLGTRLGPHRVFLGGLAVFTVASAACALAPTAGSLIAFRVVQGAGAAVMVPQVLSIIQRSLTGAAKARALGLYATVTAAGVVIGQVLGGLVVGADLFGTGWRPTFAINVPVGIALLVLGRRVLPRDRGEAGRALDLPGLVTLAISVLLLVVPLVLGPEQGWPVLCWVGLAAVVPAFCAFLIAERRASSPLFPGRLLRAPGLLPAAVALFLAMSTYGAFLLVGSVHLESGLGHSALRTGLTFAPCAVGFGLSSMYWQRLPQRVQHWISPVGLLVACVGYLGVAALMSGLATDGWAFGLVMFGCGLGFGGVTSPLLATALTHVPASEAADASGLLVTLIQLAIVVGVATYGTLYLAVVRQPTTRTPAAQSAHAASLVVVGLAGALLLAAACSLLLVRRHRLETAR